MFIFNLIAQIVIGGLAGWIAEKVMKFDTSLTMNVVLGIAGSVVGNAIIRTLGLWPGGGLIRSLVIAVAGACLLIYLYRLFNRQKA
ncbi:MAG: GlsB/YeaQ/YmgE family stress response membrane protein [Rhizobiales bacterium]|nr:GlsB/YeaQ/YmgE family stress response membrane protein [Hyphomicrobiales bacterium]MBI3674638.1 GlsB/YeaQ/YmgE family stress response membrane protein [Hyphomicrobiales bacterium]